MSSNIIKPIKVSVKSKGDLLDQAYKAISKSGESGIFQTDLCKVFSLDSRDGSRLVGNLEKQSLISREKILYKGRWTYKLVLRKSAASTESIKKPIEVTCVEGAPCFSCTFQHLCSSDDDTSQYSPAKCTWIEEWVLASFDRAIDDQQNSEI